MVGPPLAPSRIPGRHAHVLVNKRDSSRPRNVRLSPEEQTFATVIKVSIACQNQTLVHPSRPIAREQLGCGSSARLILEIDIREYLPVVVAERRRGVLLLDGPRRREKGAATWPKKKGPALA